MNKCHSVFKISVYLVILVLSSSHVQFKGLFDQASLPLPLPLRVVRCESGAVMLISTVEKNK